MSIIAEVPHYRSLKPTPRLTFLNLLAGTRFSQCNKIIEYQIVHLLDVIVSFRDLVFSCSLEFVSRIFTVTYVIREVFFLSSLNVTVLFIIFISYEFCKALLSLWK